MRLTIYTKPGCHLCDEMKAIVHRVLFDHRDSAGILLDEVDISTDTGLLERFGLDIPVLMIDGRKVAKYRIAEEELRRLIRVRGKG